ncbi:MAG: TolB family protein, partial [Pyrinomonadaceae bacterium]
EGKLAARKVDKFFGRGGPAWSPDGKVIACSAGGYSGGFHMSVIAVDVQTAAQTEFSKQRFYDAGRVSWLSDGTALVVNASEPQSFFNQIWLISYPGGEARRITSDLNEYSGTSFTSDSESLVTVQYDNTANIWLAPAGDLNRGRQITNGKLEGLVGVSWTPDGRIVYTTTNSGNSDIWIMNQDGTNQRPLTTDPHEDQNPTVSPDGRYVVFVSWRGGFPSLWRMDLDGGNLKQLTDGQEDYGPSISPDGQWIVFSSWRSGRETLWKLSIDGGQPVQIIDRFTANPAVSPDGNLIACFFQAEESGAPVRIMILPFGGGQPVKTFDLPASVARGFSPRWNPDGRSIIYP